MVQMDVQFLAGVAVTVFLALLFFAVVVLWDVALALRSVGDKIDKLEDNLDDDLTEIGHSLDSMSNLSGGGGGTQLHLSGGTISGGQPSNQEAAPSGARADGRRPDDDRYRHPQRPPGQDAPGPDRPAGPERDPPADGRSDESATEPDEDEPDEDDPDGDASEPAPEAAEDAGETTDEADDPASTDDIDDEAEPTAQADASDEGADEPDEDVAESGEDADESGEDADEAVDEPSTPHPRADRNRGRFVTAPDVTPWYVTPLDRDAIATAGPEIAGELESPEAASRNEPDEDPIVAGPASEDDIAPDGAGVEADDAETADGDGPGAGGATGRPDAESTRDSSGGAATASAGDSATPMPPDPDEMASTDESDGDTAPSDPDGDDWNASSGTDAENATDSGPDEPVFTDGRTGSGGPPSRVDPDAADETDTVLSYDENDEDAPAPGDGSVSEGPESVDFGDVTDLGQPDPDEEDVTVEEAVESMNDDAPSLSLSSHDFDVVAEADEDGAVLLFEFDPATVELTGSTKRLLRYQMRSFADDGSTPDGEVAIEGQTIVVEVPEPEGNDVQRWGEAAVSIIDRTLYLSDNSG